MGNQNNHSVTRKRLSTLAITTTLAAVGVGVVGAGAANAATNSGSPQANTQNNAAAPAAAVAVTPSTGLSSLTVTADLTGTTVDKNAATGATGTITWDTTAGAKTSPFTFDANGMPTAVKGALTNTYAAAGTYTVTVNVTDGNNTTTSKTATVTVTDETLAAKLSATSATKSTAVSLDLTGSSVDKSILNTAVTTVNWGDKTTAATFAGDPSLIKTSDTKLWHTFAADGSYTVTVTLDDGLKTKTSVQTKTFTVKVSETGVQVLQAAGATRYETGVQISAHQWASTGVTTDTRTQAKAVVLATGNDFADALVAVPLAKKVQGPLLLTDGMATTTNSAVLTEIQRVLPTKDTTVYLLGGDKALNTGIETQLQKLGYTTQRLAGPDRFATALQVAQKGMGDPTHVIVARGDEGTNHNGFADALAAGSYAANVFGGGNSAVVLSNFNTFDPTTQAYVQSKLHAGQENVAAVGGQAAAAMTTIKGSANTYVSAVGSDRYETAAKVAAAFLPNGKGAQIGVATGTVFADALTGGAYQATVGGPLLLTDPKVLPASTADAVAGFSTQEINIFGGNVAISPTVAKEIAALLKVTTIGKF
jgi:putative cell wall-binding protein